MKTIAKNRKKLIDEIFSKATNSFSYRLDNGFTPSPVDPKYAREALDKYSFSKLYCSGTHYTVHVHSNSWYEFDSIPIS